MQSVIPIRLEDANMEVLARIAKAASKKFDCTMKIDFTNGNRTAEFVGNDMYRPFIAEEVENIFKKS